jgi:hypothetical protein
LIRETRLWEKALKERWPIPEAMRGVIVKSLGKILVDAESSPREKTAAARALMAADQQNIEMEKMEQADEHEQRARLVAIAKHLGPERMSELAARAGKPIVIEPKENQGDGTGSASGIPEATQGGSEGSFDNESEGYQPEDEG